MVSITIELPETVTVSMRNGASVEVDAAKLSPVANELFIYGIGQKVRDSASGATKAAEAEGSKGVEAEALAMMESCVAALYAGEWSHRGEGTGVDPRTAVARSIVRRAIKEKLGSKSPQWATFTGLSDKDQLAKLDETYDGNRELFDPLVDAEMKRRADAAKAKSKAASALSFNL